MSLFYHIFVLVASLLCGIAFEKIWSKGLEKYDELEGIGWEWQSLDGCMVKAPLALEAVGKNPTDRGKNGDKTQRTDG